MCENLVLSSALSYYLFDTLSVHLVSPLWNLWLRYCVITTMLYGTTGIMVHTWDKFLDSTWLYLSPPPSSHWIFEKLAIQSFPSEVSAWDIKYLAAIKCVVSIQPNFIPYPVLLTIPLTLSGYKISPLWSMRLRYCAFATILQNNRNYRIIEKLCLIKLGSHSFSILMNDLFCYCVQLQYETIILVREIVFIQSKIEINKHKINLA